MLFPMSKYPFIKVRREERKKEIIIRLPLHILQKNKLLLHYVN